MGVNVFDQFLTALTTAVWDFLTGELLPIGSALAVLMVIWGGFLYIQNRGEEAKKVIEAALIGLVIMALAVLIINTVIAIFG